MNEKYLVYKVTSWVQDRPWLMLLAGIGCLTGLFHEFTRYQAAACLVSGLINLTTGLAPRYQRLTVGKIASVGHLLSLIGFWSLLIGFANIDGSTALFLTQTSFMSGAVSVIWFLLFKIMKL